MFNAPKTLVLRSLLDQEIMVPLANHLLELLKSLLRATQATSSEKLDDAVHSCTHVFSSIAPTRIYPERYESEIVQGVNRTKN
jgi:chromosome condensin MukBEF MukE localization factor